MAELSIVFRTKLENLGAESGSINTTRGYPVSLRVLVDMILRGSNINREPAERDPNQACLTLLSLSCLTAICVNTAQHQDIATQEPKNVQCQYTRP